MPRSWCMNVAQFAYPVATPSSHPSHLVLFVSTLLKHTGSSRFSTWGTPKQLLSSWYLDRAAPRRQRARVLPQVNDEAKKWVEGSAQPSLSVPATAGWRPDLSQSRHDLLLGVFWDS